MLYAVSEQPALRSVHDDKNNFFYFTEYELGGETMSLYHLENEVVRKEFKEPRIHFALNCASASCPQLPAEAFPPEKLQEQLDRESRAFCQRPDSFTYENGVAMASQIFEWYADDFAGGAVPFCRAHGRDDVPENAPVEFIPYDWTLTAQPGRALFE